jgi:hypothetical protein
MPEERNLELLLNLSSAGRDIIFQSSSACYVLVEDAGPETDVSSGERISQRIKIKINLADLGYQICRHGEQAGGAM